MTRSRKQVIAAWCLYDWANSAFTTLVVTFVYATYFSRAMAPDEVTGTALWSRAIGLTGILVALLSPILGVIADRGGRRRRFLLVATGICVVATAMLAFVAPGAEGAVLTALALFVVANVAFEMGMVFYNAFLPVIAPPERMGRVSGYGWGLGYGGGLVCLLLALAILIRDPPLLGIPTAEGFNIRATNLLVAGWFLLFSLPFLLLVREERRPGAPPAPGTVGSAFAALNRTFRQIRRYREVSLFLVSRLIYNDGLVTVFAFGGIYAAGTFGLELSEVIQFGIAINVAAGLGAWGFGFVDDRLGGRTTVLITIAALIVFTAIAVVAPSREWLWVAGIGIGAFVGPNQAASRSLMGRFVPEPRRAEFFGFFAFSGKATAFAGPLLLGVVTQLFDSQRAGVATVILFFVAGGLLLLTVDERRGIEAGGAEQKARESSLTPGAGARLDHRR